MFYCHFFKTRKTKNDNQRLKSDLGVSQYKKLNLSENKETQTETQTHNNLFQKIEIENNLFLES